MSPGLNRVRRATVDDLPVLQSLWASAHLPSADFEKRFTDFQVVESEDGALLGTIALEVAGRHGRLHSEAFADFAMADSLRELLWARMQSVAENLGLARLWIADAAPFWKRNGLLPARGDLLQKLPAAWQTLDCEWLTVQLRDETVLQATLEKQFTHFQEEERRRREETLQKARVWKIFAISVVVVLCGAMVYFCIYLLRHRSVLMRH